MTNDLLRPKLAAFDLDGTLAQSKQTLTHEMGALLARLIEKMPVAIMSGGAWHQFERQLLPYLPAGVTLERLYLFPDNAAQCYTFEGSWRLRYEHHFTNEERERIMAAFTEALAESGMAEPPEPHWGERIEDRGAQISFSALGQNAPVPEKKRWHDAHDSERRALLAALSKRLPDFEVKMGGLTTIDILRHGITKAYGLRELEKMSGIPVADMLYVGDALMPGGNDEVVKETPVKTQDVEGPKDTARIIETLLTERGTLSAAGAPAGRYALLTVLILAVGIGTILAFSWYRGHLSTNTVPPENNHYANEINVSSPLPGALVSSPLTVSGQALGTWYFEASFPVMLEDPSGTVLAEAPAQAQSDWMTSGFVPFTVTLTFPTPTTTTGMLILKNDNPSGDPTRDKHITIPVRFP